MCLKISKIYWGTADVVITECRRFKQKTLLQFIDYRDNYIDLIPNVPLDLKRQDSRFYKCNPIFLVSLGMSIRLLVTSRILDGEDLVVKDFDNYIHSRDFYSGVTPDDILRVNQILDYTIGKMS